jgi:hypothetical protein
VGSSAGADICSLSSDGGEDMAKSGTGVRTRETSERVVMDSGGMTKCPGVSDKRVLTWRRETAVPLRNGIDVGCDGNSATRGSEETIGL